MQVDKPLRDEEMEDDDDDKPSTSAAPPPAAGRKLTGGGAPSSSKPSKFDSKPAKKKSGDDDDSDMSLMDADLVRWQGCGRAGQTRLGMFFCKTKNSRTPVLDAVLPFVVRP